MDVPAGPDLSLYGPAVAHIERLRRQYEYKYATAWLKRLKNEQIYFACKTKH